MRHRPSRLVAAALAAVLGSIATAATAPVLRPLPLGAACQKAGYTALQDSAGTLRVLRYVRLIPDNTARQTQYYSARGALQSAKLTGSGFVGLLYDLTLTARGNTLTEKGYRAKFFTTPAERLLRDAAAVKAGRCAP